MSWRRVLAGLVAVVLAWGGGGFALRSAASDPSPYEVLVSGLQVPWDITFVGELMLFNEKSGAVWSRRANGPAQRLTISGFPEIFAQGESGLMGMVADPAAGANQRFYTCAATASAGQPVDVRVQRWRLTSDTTAVADGVVVTGLPLTSGRHAGCRLRFGADGKLYVGTGDAAVGTTPQDLTSLGGKVLRVNGDGSIPSDNPYVSRGGNASYIWTYGHRNIQGLALRPNGEVWSVEHGSNRDDEVNLIARGANYGWDPIPGYDESKPMTDTTKFPSAMVAAWSSGATTIATSGGTFLVGDQWGDWDGWLAVGVLKGSHIRLMRIGSNGSITRSIVLPGSTAFGRIRTVQVAPDGSLLFTTANGSDDKIIRRDPAAHEDWI